MLLSLNVQNYALISKLDIKFQKGFCIITGETGAGKSILLGALSLVLGQRADTSVLKNQEEKCIVETVFDIAHYQLQYFFEKHELDYDAKTIIRREISPSGKSRAFINDTPVNLTTLRELSHQLVDIHSQHQNLLLGDNLFQMKVVDAVAQHPKLIDDYQKKYHDFKQAQSQYRQLVEEAEQAKADMDYYQHRFDQLNAANLVAGEQAELEEELEQLTHAEEIKTNLTQTAFVLSGEGDTVLSQLRDAQNALLQIENYYTAAKEMSNRIESAYIELKDLAEEVEVAGNDMEFNNERLEFVNQRLNTIYDLQQKHRVETVEELLDIQNELAEKLNAISTSDEKIKELKAALNQKQAQLKKQAAMLTAGRRKAIPAIEKEIKNMLVQLGMPAAVFTIKLEAAKDFTPQGADVVTFLFSANKNMAPQNITKVVSGGEMARVMLSIKALISKNIALPTIIFDEIDTGVSGDIAGKTGRILKEMAQHIQLINITHLPQIAGKGDYHYKVYKEDDHEKTHTKMKLLTKKERLQEIAKMLSGENITQAALDNAKTLLET